MPLAVSCVGATLPLGSDGTHFRQARSGADGECLLEAL